MKVKAQIKPWRFPEATERQLSRSIVEMVDKISVRAKANLSRLKFDASDDEIEDEESDLEDYALALIPALLLLLRPMSVTIYIFNSSQWLRIAKQSGGAKVASVMELDTFGARQSEKWFIEKQAQWLSVGELALRKLVNNILADWSTNVRQAAALEKNDKYVKAVIDQRLSVWKSWASNRSGGIVGTFNSMLMMQRLKDAKVESYTWRGVMDERERLKHIMLEGKEIRIDAIHIFPGEEYNCRCWAVPVWAKQENEE